MFLKRNTNSQKKKERNIIFANTAVRITIRFKKNKKKIRKCSYTNIKAKCFNFHIDVYMFYSRDK